MALCLHPNHALSVRHPAITGIVTTSSCCHRFAPVRLLLITIPPDVDTRNALSRPAIGRDCHVKPFGSAQDRLCETSQAVGAAEIGARIRD